MKRKTIVEKNEKRNGRKKEKKKKRREKMEKEKVSSHSQETQMNLKIDGFLFLQGPNLFHFIIIDSKTRLWVQFQRMSELERTVEMISNPLVLWINKPRPTEGNDLNAVSS